MQVQPLAVISVEEHTAAAKRRENAAHSKVWGRDESDG